MAASVRQLLTLIAQIVLSYFEVVFRLVFKPTKRSVERDIVLVTGAGHGIGREVALAFGRLGAKIVVWDINKVGNPARYRPTTMKTAGNAGVCRVLCVRSECRLPMPKGLILTLA